MAMALLAVAFGALSLPIAKALKGEKFERGVEQIIAKISLAQELMLDFRTDVELTLKQKEKGVVCHITAGRILPTHLEKGIDNYQIIEGIEQIAFDNVPKQKIVLLFDGKIGTTPRGILKLSTRNKKKSVVLQGFPAHIRRGNFEQKTCEAEYPEEILSLI